MQKQKVFTLLAVFIVAISALLFARTKASSQTLSAPKKVHTTIYTSELTSQLDKITQAHDNLDIGVAVIDTTTGQSYTYGEKAAYYGASTTKVLVAALFMHEAEMGKRSLRDTVNGTSASHQIALMIEQSDNEAWTALKDAVDRENLNTYAASLGLTSFVSQDNLISTSDMAKILQKLYAGKLLNPSNTQQLLGYMHKSVRNYIAPALPSTYTVYHKAGWLDDRLMDTGIITNGKKSYVLVIFSKTYVGDYDVREGSTLFGHITKAVDNVIR